ncbi:hypothetical protein HF086_002568 [Spodoptera exigua]|uniref:Uncharacterized protein n=1 Tax=Spodoptera exigua TaxID=7107 RepID=A0A922MVH2_SPOEX|nr:hypothetical protein HF086_002568 [Spodoptera exigua]
MLSREGERLRALEREVRGKLDKALERERDYTPEAGPSHRREYRSYNSQHNHSLSTPTRRRNPSVTDDCRKPKEPKSTLEFLKIF